MNVIWDLDGTLTDGHAFDYLLDTKPKQWDEWNRNIYHHKVWKPIAKLYRDAISSGRHTNYIITARPENTRLYTENWLRKHSLDRGHRGLFMRGSGDRRPDFIVKEEILKNLLAQGFTFHRAYDDRAEVLEMYKKYGIETIWADCGEIFP